MLPGLPGWESPPPVHREKKATVSTNMATNMPTPTAASPTTPPAAGTPASPVPPTPLVPRPPQLAPLEPSLTPLAELARPALPSPLSPFDPVEVMQREIAEMLGGGEMAAVNIIPITVALMQLAERPRWGLSGYDKKRLVVRALQRYVDTVADPDLRLSLAVLVQMTVPDMIDTLASVSSGETIIKGGCFRRLLGLCCDLQPSRPTIAPSAEATNSNVSIS